MHEHHCTQCGVKILRAVHPRTVRPFCDSACYGAWQRGKAFDEQGKPERPAKGCSVPDCVLTHFGRGYCRRHYLQLHYSVTPDRAPKPATLTCAHCGKRSPPSHASAKYCSMKCSAEARKKPFILNKGYRKILMPRHPRADGKGYVFEHIVIMEAVLGRALAKGEEVHHRDFDRANNAPDNLVVCASHAEHMRFHARPS